LRSAGVRLCMGTDSLASVPTLDLWDDVLALHRAVPALEGRWLVHMATRAGAEALGFDDLGWMAPGARATFAFFEGPASIPGPHAFLLSGDAHPRALAA